MNRLMRMLPHENFIYFGDTARIPYGGKSRETVIRYSIENAFFLLEKQIKLLVVACNTATAFALEELQRILPVPIIGVINPGVEKAVSVTKEKRIGVLGTKGTIQSGAYLQEIHRLLPEALVVSIACPLFVPLVEEGFSNHPVTKTIIGEYLFPLERNPVDTLLLGCTHYPLLEKLIQEVSGDGVYLVDPASTCAEKVMETLLANNLNNFATDSTCTYFVSDDPEKFQDLAYKLFGLSINPVNLVNSQDSRSLENLNRYNLLRLRSIASFDENALKSLVLKSTQEDLHTS